MTVLFVQDMVVGEGDGFVELTVRLDAASTLTVTVKYATANFTASSNFDYAAASGTLTFLPGETSKVVRVDLFGQQARADDIEQMERFTFNLSAPTNATLGGEGYAWVQIVDNDTIRNTPELFVRDVVVDEKAGVAKFVVSLGRVYGQSSLSPVTVDYATTDGSAQAGSDYVATSGRLTFAPGESVKTVEVPLIDDGTAEGVERFTLNLSNPSSAVLAKGSGQAEIAPNDAAAVSQPRLLVQDTVVGEGDGYVDVQVLLSAPGTNTVTVKYATANFTASSNFDYAGASGTLTFLPGETSKVVRVDLYGEQARADDIEQMERFTFSLSAPTNATLGGEGEAWLQIVDNDTIRNTPELFVRDVVVDEKAGVAKFVVSLGRVYGQSSLSPVTVDYATADGSAQAGSDYVATSGRLTFAPGESVKTVEVPLVDDGTAEGVERFTLNLSNPGSAVLAKGSGQAEIAPNDAAAVSQPRLLVQDMVVGEGDGYVDVQVLLSAPGTNTVTVKYATANFTGSSNFDYAGASGTLTFLPGETSKVVRVDLYGEQARGDDIEQMERFTFGLSAPTNATLGGEGYAWVQVVDNDSIKDTPELFVRDVVVDEKAGVARFVVSLGRVYGQSSLSTVTADYATADGSAQAGSDYVATSGRLTFAPGESVKTVEVPLIDDSAAEGIERFTLSLSNPGSAVLAKGSGQAEIAPNDAAALSQPRLLVQDMVVGEGDGYVDVQVLLSAPGTNTVTVKYATANFTASGNFDFAGASGTLTFLPGETSKVVRVDLYGEQARADDIEQMERFTFNLSAPTNATLGGEGYAWLQVVDNDSIRDTPELFVRDAVVDEKAGVARFVVSLGRVYGQSSLSTVTADYATADGSAQAGSDYVATSGRLTFAPGESVKTVEVPLIDDSTAEGIERFTLNLSNPGSAVLAKGGGLAEIAPNDAAAVSQPRLLVQDMVVGEGDGYVDVQVLLSAPGTNTVTVKYATANVSASGNFDYAGASGTLTFLPGETSKVVRVELYGEQARGDDIEPLERFTFNLSAPTNATLGNEGYAWIQVVDNDTIKDTPDVFVRDVVVDEKAGVAKFVVSLGLALGQSSLSTVTVDYTTVDETAQAGQDYLAKSGTLMFAPGESSKTVVVDLIDDTLTEGLERFHLRLSNATSSTIADADAVAEIGANDAIVRGQPVISAVAASVGESDGQAVVQVRLSQPSTSVVTVNYATQSGTANSGDFTAVTGTLRFDPGQTIKTIAIELQDNTTAEPTENFRVNFTAPSGATLPATSTTLTIFDNDASGVAVMSGGRGDDVYVVTSLQDVIVEDADGGSDTVLASLDYTLPAFVENLVLAAGPALNGTGNDRPNVFVGNAADNRMDGKEGIDTVVAGGPRAAFVLSSEGTNLVLSGASGGRDTLVSIERVQFTDTVLALDTSPGGNAWSAYALFNAGFDRAPTPAELSLWTTQLDKLGSTQALAQTMINYYAPGVTDEVLVPYLWNTVVEAPLNQGDYENFVGQLKNGTFTQASLLEFAAFYPLNTVELAGIAGQSLTLDPAFFFVPG